MSININNQEGYFDPRKQGDTVIIIGCGATGSYAADLFVAAGLSKVVICDFDYIEGKNLQNQSFTGPEIGMQKVDAKKAQYDWMSEDNPIVPLNVKVEKIDDLQLVENEKYSVLILTDTIESRRTIAAMFEEDSNCNRVIETRLTIATSDVYTFTPFTDMMDGRYTKWKEDIDRIEKIVSDPKYQDDQETTPCGGPLAIASTAMITASLAFNAYLFACKNPQFLPPFRTWFDSRVGSCLVQDD